MDPEGSEPDRSAWVFRFHLGEASVRGIGSFEVRRGQSRWARILSALLRVPQAGSAVPVRVDIRRHGDREVWTRQLGRRVFVSRQRRLAGFVRERIGPLELQFRVAAETDGVAYAQEKAALCLGPLRLGLPRHLAPQVHARAVARGARAFDVRVDVCAPQAEPLFSYWGTVEEAY